MRILGKLPWKNNLVKIYNFMYSGSAYHYIDSITGGNQVAAGGQGNALSMIPIGGSYSGGRRSKRRRTKSRRSGLRDRKHAERSWKKELKNKDAKIKGEGK